MKRGFTLVELIIVLFVISILAGISVLGVQAQLNNSRDSQRKGMASSVSSALERYYKTNNEYPSASQLGGVTTALPPANYNLASQKLGMAVDSFKAGTYSFVPCGAGANCSDVNLNKKYIYYATRYDQTDTATVYRVIMPVGTTTAQCMYSMPTTDVGSLVYLIMYWSDEAQGWQVAKSANGTVTMQRRANTSSSWAAADSSSTGCPFISL